MNDIGVLSEEDALVYKMGGSENKIFRGKIIDDDLIEGRYIYVDEKWDKKKFLLFYKKQQ